MSEYIFRISKRDPERPLLTSETVILEFAAADPKRFAAAVEALAGMLKIKGTPEDVQAFLAGEHEAHKIRTLINSIVKG